MWIICCGLSWRNCISFSVVWLVVGLSLVWLKLNSMLLRVSIRLCLVFLVLRLVIFLFRCWFCFCMLSSLVLCRVSCRCLCFSCRWVRCFWLRLSKVCW